MDGRQFIPGIRATEEALKHGISIREIWLAVNRKGPRVEEISRIARERGIPVSRKKGLYLDQMLPGISHQGVAALAEPFAYTDLDRLIRISSTDSQPALIIAADHITDEGNLGAIIRASAFFGAHGLVIPKDRSAGVTERVLKRSSGAGLLLPVARVVNLRNALERLSGQGFWIIGTAGEGPCSVYEFDWVRSLVLVLGREDTGLTQTVRKVCHQLVAIPARGGLGSLNVSVAGGIILSEIIRQRFMASGAGKDPGVSKP
ncbi:MAG: 23S rRNA (guanosine(2251)-2'-O)-methyltransferase RlmB [Pseudomonadota bacterium]